MGVRVRLLSDVKSIREKIYVVISIDRESGFVTIEDNEGEEFTIYEKLLTFDYNYTYLAYLKSDIIL